MNIISKLVKSVVGFTNILEDIIFDVVIKPLLALLYQLVKGTQWVGVIDHLFDLLAEAWPPQGVAPQTTTTTQTTKETPAKQQRRTLLGK